MWTYGDVTIIVGNDNCIQTKLKKKAMKQIEQSQKHSIENQWVSRRQGER